MADAELLKEFVRLVALASDEEKEKVKNFVISHDVQLNIANSSRPPASYL